MPQLKIEPSGLTRDLKAYEGGISLLSRVLSVSFSLIFRHQILELPVIIFFSSTTIPPLSWEYVSSTLFWDLFAWLSPDYSRPSEAILPYFMVDGRRTLGLPSFVSRPILPSSIFFF